MTKMSLSEQDAEDAAERQIARQADAVALAEAKRELEKKDRLLQEAAEAKEREAREAAEKAAADEAAATAAVAAAAAATTAAATTAAAAPPVEETATAADTAAVAVTETPEQAVDSPAGGDAAALGGQA